MRMNRDTRMAYGTNLQPRILLNLTLIAFRAPKLKSEGLPRTTQLVTACHSLSNLVLPPICIVTQRIWLLRASKTNLPLVRSESIWNSGEEIEQFQPNKSPRTLDC